MTESLSPADDGDPDHLTADTTFELLRHPYRRSVLRVLDRRDASVRVDELVDALDRLEGIDGGPYELAVELHHAHLPKLHDAAVIEYDRTAETVAPLDRVTELLPHLDLVAPRDRAYRLGHEGIDP